ncbi:unnamed protein product [Lactuca virosa]|uniref:DUF4408 domain-containing protein n=1 Tax=Lactuca virosa TaxID=75947 RepID=A0AAU9MR43_9ASTR|nr:unnamed protein product [Lactuca virosa]
MFEFTCELIAVAASNPHLIFLLCNLIIVILILVSLEPASNSHHNCTATPIPPPPSPPPLHPAVNNNKTFETTTPTTLPQETSVNVSIDVDELSYDCTLSVEENEEEQDDDLRRRVEEFINKINKGWKAEKEKLQLSLAH